MNIREIEEKDNLIIEGIIKKSLESFKLDIPGTAYYDPYLNNLYGFYQTETKARYWVIENEEGEVVGGCGIGPFDKEGRIGELQKLYLSPKAQGKGLSKELMQVALDFAKEHYIYCYLETFAILESANHLYEKCGFKRLNQSLSETTHDSCDTWFIKEL
ncbi:GNAT family N-acetyltransferase [Oceanobacillus arenosus]|uniref:GNAT family N-acetyltransferase n=1 Tax=Oceanobacillus arenosus TaxID=1229153 RepID=A0A3D8PX89_9BACI|nr:GNAT family N-acetyltransferase [Oceanobacillus arenosus]RDW20157.1 GNAT family N-acetyltransferase [Oceanobacillus arenosus]